jgi:hypothetical protein
MTPRSLAIAALPVVGAAQAAPALRRVHALDLGQRERSYPIRTSPNDQEVFAVDTPTGLAYVTLPLNPVRGSSIKVELRDKGANRGRCGVLSIVEAEIYETPRNP